MDLNKPLLEYLLPNKTASDQSNEHFHPQYEIMDNKETEIPGPSNDWQLFCRVPFIQIIIVCCLGDTTFIWKRLP
eukprot:UN14567